VVRDLAERPASSAAGHCAQDSSGDCEADRRHIVAVARLLGHESAATTLNHYAGLFPTDLDDIASRLDGRLTIASHGASSDAELSPTTAPTRTSQHQSTGT
jgi:hypothetical protein